MASKPEPVETIRDTPLSDALSQRYLAYALSTIKSRSLPDVRDGLKPVHRRLLYAMRLLKLDPKSGFKKCARIVGDVMGKYHPHGDQAIYDAMVRLAQSFAVRYPLVDGQGNFGNIDGDNPAAMRYTEARLTDVAWLLLEGIDEDAVDFRDTYDGEDSEPVVMPANFPNLLANGAAGIAVGMATNIPPHNVAELCDGMSHIIKTAKHTTDGIANSRVTFDKLGELVKGPDFPTGGIMVEPAESIVESYRTGRGSFRLRARWETEDLGRGVYNIVITEIPYQVQKARLIERIAELLEQRKLPFLNDIRDESAEDIRIVIEPKNRTVEAETLMEQLFQLTDLEVRISLNMNVLDGGVTPRVMSLREVLTSFLLHRHEVLERRARFRLEKIEQRLEILEGFLIAYLNLDEIIRIIREEDEPKPVMMKKFKLSEVQAEAILNMRLRQLRKLEEEGIRREHAELSEERKSLKTLLKDEKKRWKAIGEQIAESKKAFSEKTELGRRRTEIGKPPSAVVVPLEALIEREPITVVCSEKGWVRAIKGHGIETASLRFKDGDRFRFAVEGQTTDKLVVFATNGRFYTIGCDKLPGGRGHGEPVRLLIDLGNGNDVMQMMIHQPDRKLLVCSDAGRGFVVEENDVIAQTKNGKQVLNLGTGEEARVAHVLSEGDDHVAVIGDNHKLLIFPLDELPEMSRGRGVILQRYSSGGLADAKTMKASDGLTWITGAGVRSEPKPKQWMGKRAQAGLKAPKGFPRNNRFS